MQRLPYIQAMELDAFPPYLKADAADGSLCIKVNRATFKNPPVELLLLLQQFAEVLVEICPLLLLWSFVLYNSIVLLQMVFYSALIATKVVEDKVIKDKVIKDKVTKDKVTKDKVVKDKVIRDKVIRDMVSRTRSSIHILLNLRADAQIIDVNLVCNMSQILNANKCMLW